MYYILHVYCICIYIYICIAYMYLCIAYMYTVYVHIGIYLRFLKINAYNPHEVHASYGCSGPVAQAVARRDQ